MTTSITIPLPAVNRRPMRTDDIIRAIPLKDLVVSTNGGRAIFSRSDLNEARDRRQDTLWLLNVNQATAEPFLANQEDADISRPVWSPVNETITFLLSKEGPAQLQLLLGSDTTPQALTSLHDGVDDFLWSPKGDRIIVLSVSPDDDELPDDVTISTRADFQSQEEPIKSSSIWVVRTKVDDNPRQLITLPFPVTFSFLSNDGETLYYTVDETIEPYYGGATCSLRSLDVTSGSQQIVRAFTVPGKDEPLESAPSLLPSPDGTRVAFSIGNPNAPPEFSQDEIFIMDLASGGVEMATDGYDREVGGDGFQWLDDDELITINSDHGNANLARINIRDHTVTPWWTGQRVVDSFAYARRAKRLLAVASDFVTPSEIYDINMPEKAKKLTGVNNFLCDELILTKPEEISYQGPSEHTIHGYLHKPPSFDPTHTYPMITIAHGGPYAWWSSAYNGDIQAMAAAGYLVFYPNPRGSMSYGQAFASALAGEWPGPEYDDIMAGIDHLLSRPYVDRTKLGISGASAGGTLTDWAITHTDRFGAAVSVSDIADLLAYWFLGDQPDIEDPKKRPWLDPKDRKLSPITYGSNIKTPTLFITGSRDVRTPAAVGGEMMFRLLKHLRVPTALIKFEGAGHAIFRSRDARHPGLAVYYLLRWFDLHLMGRPTLEFHVKRVG